MPVCKPGKAYLGQLRTRGWKPKKTVHCLEQRQAQHSAGSQAYRVCQGKTVISEIEQGPNKLFAAAIAHCGNRVYIS